MVYPPKALYVACTDHESFGKTALCVGLAKEFAARGLKVGYFKPLGVATCKFEGKNADEDALLFKNMLKIEASIWDINPILLGYRYLETYSSLSARELDGKISRAYKKASKGVEVMIVESVRELSLGAALGLSVPKLARKLNAGIILVSSRREDRVVDEVINAYSNLVSAQSKVLGVVFNNIPSHLINRAKGVFKEALEANGVPLLGVIPESIQLTAPTVEEVASTLGGDVLCAEEGLSKRVETYMVGAMAAEAAVKNFRRAREKAVITSGDRPEIALAALETDTSLLILTDNIYPEARLRAKAEEKGVPIILVPYDAYTTINKLSELVGRIKAGDERRIKIAHRLVAENVDLQAITALLHT